MSKIPYLENFKKEIKLLGNLPIINNFLLILGGGKFGKLALEYGKEHNFSLILIIDNDNSAILSIEAEEIVDLKELTSKIHNYIDNNNKKNKKIIKYQSDLTIIPLIFSFGIPEFIVPVVPVHIFAYILHYFLNFPLSCYFNSNSVANYHFYLNKLTLDNIIKNLINETIFKTFLKSLPKEIIFDSDRENGIISLSYAQINEVCPSNCIGPKDYCRPFNREKPRTITSIVQNCHKDIKNGWVLESHQVKPGLGILYGKEIQNNLSQILKFIYNTFKIKGVKKQEEYFFCATACNCHGILNIFSF